ncbi:MAG: cell division protein FtsZ, partial [Thermoflexia bacterium]
RAVMSEGGAALMAVGEGSGEERAAQAAQQAISNRLLDITIDGAQRILFNITGGPDLSLHEVYEAATVIRETAHPDVDLRFGAVINEAMDDKVRITLIATGFDSTSRPVRVARPAARETREPPVPVFDRDDLEIPAFLRRRSG